MNMKQRLNKYLVQVKIHAGQVPSFRMDFGLIPLGGVPLTSLVPGALLPSLPPLHQSQSPRNGGRKLFLHFSQLTESLPVPNSMGSKSKLRCYFCCSCSAREGEVA